MFHGYSPTKQHYFYGIKVHMVLSKDGIPVEILFTPGSEHDMKAFKRFTLDIPRGSVIYGDRAYTNYEFEDLLKAELRFIQSKIRKRIETVFSEITRLFPRAINAVTSSGFEIKVFSFILAYTFSLFFKKKLALT